MSGPTLLATTKCCQQTRRTQPQHGIDSDVGCLLFVSRPCAIMVSGCGAWDQVDDVSQDRIVDTSNGKLVRLISCNDGDAHLFCVFLVPV
jgi:hypothetical protein